MKNIDRTKYLVCICFIICFTKLNAQPRNATLFITGNGENPQVLIAITDKFGFNTIVDTIMLNVAKPIKYNVKIEAAQSVFLRYGKNSRVQLWLTPGRSLNVTLKDTPEFSGPDAVFAQYFADDTDYWKKIDADYGKRNPEYEKERNLHSDKYFLIQDSIVEDRTRFLRAYFSKVNASAKQQFIEQQSISLHYLDLYYKISFPGSDYEKFKFIQAKYKINKPYHYQHSDVADFNNVKLLSNSSYRMFFQFLVGEMGRRKIKNSGEKFSFDEYLKECMRIIDQLTTNAKVRDDFKAVFFHDAALDVKINKDAKIAGVITNVISGLLSNGNKNLAIVKAEIEKVIAESKFAKGAPAPDFILKDTNGKTYTLDSFKGKKLIFDMSASWCGPCIAALPEWNKLAVANSNNKDVVFVSLSLDDNEAEWGAFMKKRPTEGLHLYAGSGFKSKFAKDYEIIAIPHYLLIDQNGKIATYNAQSIDSEAVLTFLK